VTPTSGKLQVVSHPVENTLAYVGMNVKNPPFNTLKVRQAVAHVVPFEKMFTSAIFARGVLGDARPHAEETGSRDRLFSAQPVSTGARRFLISQAARAACALLETP
jgi:ABC-type transport system substrate-binding protein